MGDFFNVTMKGEETLSEDLSAFLLGLREPIRSGLHSVADGFSNSLDKHIQHDVYDEYDPKRYPRRQMKDSLMSPDYKEISVHDLSLTFQYEPKGFHRGKMKDMLGAEWDDMIHRYVVLDKETGATKDIIENPNATTDKKLLVLRDSYADSLAPFLSQDFAAGLVPLVDHCMLGSDYHIGCTKECITSCGIYAKLVTCGCSEIDLCTA